MNAVGVYQSTLSPSATISDKSELSSGGLPAGRRQPSEDPSHKINLHDHS